MRMTRKRFIRMVMSCGIQRNEAQRIVWEKHNLGVPYFASYRVWKFDYEMEKQYGITHPGESPSGKNISRLAEGFMQFGILFNEAANSVKKFSDCARDVFGMKEEKAKDGGLYDR